MKRFWIEAKVVSAGTGYSVALDGRAVRTQGKRPQIVPSLALAQALSAEWAAQSDEVDPACFVLRDLADMAIDVIAADREAAITGLLRYAETDTLCYRAGTEDALRARQDDQWEPLVAVAEARWDLHFRRIEGVLHRPLPAPTIARLAKVLNAENDFTLAALTTLASLAASLIVALAALQPGAEAEVLWAASELEEDWQAELWGRDHEAETRRARRFAAFSTALDFARLARG